MTDEPTGEPTAEFAEELPAAPDGDEGVPEATFNGLTDDDGPQDVSQEPGSVVE